MLRETGRSGHTGTGSARRVEPVGHGLTTTGLSLAGTDSERVALTTLRSGDTVLGLWAVFLWVVGARTCVSTAGGLVH
jgi:hypothetical protein